MANRNESGFTIGKFWLRAQVVLPDRGKPTVTISVGMFYPSSALGPRCMALPRTLVREPKLQFQSPIEQTILHLRNTKSIVSKIVAGSSVPIHRVSMTASKTKMSSPRNTTTNQTPVQAKPAIARKHSSTT